MAKDEASGANEPRADLDDVMFVPVDDEQQGGEVLTEAEAKAFMARPIRAQREKETTGA